RPLEADLQVLASMSAGVVRVNTNGPGLPRAAVVAGDVAAVFAGVDDLGVAGIEGDVPGLAAADILPVADHDAARETVARVGLGADVLHTAADAVRDAVVAADVIELGDRQRWAVPRRAAIDGDVHAAVVAVDDPPRIFRVDPDVVMVAVVRPLDALQR